MVPRPWRRWLILGTALVAVAIIALWTGRPRPLPPLPATAPPLTRPAAWAVPVAWPGLPNLHCVTPTLYRGAQPEPEGFAQLRRLGIKTVISLRSFHSDRDACAATGLDYLQIDEKAWHAEDEDLVTFLRATTDPARQPVFVHCQHGADRTGTMIAAYRIVIQGWSKDQAIAEMTQGGYGFHPLWTNLVQYIRKLDTDRIRRQIGGPPPPTGLLLIPPRPGAGGGSRRGRCSGSACIARPVQGHRPRPQRL